MVIGSPEFAVVAPGGGGYGITVALDQQWNCGDGGVAEAKVFSDQLLYFGVPRVEDQDRFRLNV